MPPSNSNLEYVNWRPVSLDVSNCTPVSVFANLVGTASSKGSWKSFARSPRTSTVQVHATPFQASSSLTINLYLLTFCASVLRRPRSLTPRDFDASTGGRSAWHRAPAKPPPPSQVTVPAHVAGGPSNQELEDAPPMTTSSSGPHSTPSRGMSTRATGAAVAGDVFGRRGLLKNSACFTKRPSSQPRAGGANKKTKRHRSCIATP
mmetsp:Transcript_25344/g.86935  ORF Transcript_25344/g.86935 Transcript_25344/m.86935 type:complete len:205 (+) Transcript_25344:1306-1920(+)